MSSHHEWAEEVTAQHDAQKPYAPKNGQPLRFKAGGPVIYTNPASTEFPLRVTGFYQRPASPCGQYTNGIRYLLNRDCPWFPVPESRLRLDESRTVPELEAATQIGAPAAGQRCTRLTRTRASRPARQPHPRPSNPRT